MGSADAFWGDSGMVGYANEALSSIYMYGSDGYSYVVFGFQFWQSPKASLDAIRDFYVTSPKERSVTEIAKAFPKLTIPSNLITEELKAARHAHWEYIKLRADEING